MKKKILIKVFDIRKNAYKAFNLFSLLRTYEMYQVIPGDVPTILHFIRVGIILAHECALASPGFLFRLWYVTLVLARLQFTPFR